VELAARWQVLAYILDFDGALLPSFASVLVTERVTPRLLEDYDHSTGFTATWVGLVFDICLNHFIRTGRYATPDILASELAKRGVTGQQQIQYLQASDRARSVSPRSEAHLRYLIEQLRDFQLTWRSIDSILRRRDEIEREPREAVRKIAMELTDLAEQTQSAQAVWDFRAQASERLRRHERFTALGSSITGHYTGLVPLDQQTRGLLPGELLVFAGRTSVGKSVAMQHVAKTAFVRGCNVIYASAEMGWSADFNPIMDRMEAMLTGFYKASQLRWGDFDPRHLPNLRLWFDYFSQLPGNLYVIPPMRCETVARLKSECRTLAQRGQVGLIVVDYINEITAGRRETWIDKHEVVLEMQRLGQELECPVVSATQMSRYGLQRGDDADAGELSAQSEGIANVCDVFLRIRRDKTNRRRLVFDVMKNRNAGESGWSFSTECDWTIPLLGGVWDNHFEGSQRKRGDVGQ